MRGTLEKLYTAKGKVNIIHTGAGTINEGDVLLAAASKAIIIGFTTRVEPGAKRLADSEKVDIRLYDIIYRLSEDVQNALEGLLSPVRQEIVEGNAVVRAVFSVGRRSRIARRICDQRTPFPQRRSKGLSEAVRLYSREPFPA